MKRLLTAALLTCLALPAARQPKAYQVTGEVTEASDDLIVVTKGKEKFEIARTPETKVTGKLEKGAKATVEYRMTATSAEAKEGGGAKAKAKAK